MDVAHVADASGSPAAESRARASRGLTRRAVSGSRLGKRGNALSLISTPSLSVSGADHEDWRSEHRSTTGAILRGMRRSDRFGSDEGIPSDERGGVLGLFVCVFVDGVGGCGRMGKREWE